MEKRIKSNKGKKTIAVSQIILLVTSIVAIGFIVGNSLPVVEAAGGVGAALWFIFKHGSGSVLNIGNYAAFGTYFGYITQTILVAAAAAALVYGVFWVAGAGKRNLQAIFVEGAITAGATSTAAIAMSLFSTGPPGWVVAVATAVIMTVWAGFSYQNFAQEKVVFMPGAWMPSVSGENNCEKCNDLEYGCTEYQCHTFGKECILINKGESEEKRKCVQDGGNDYTPPKVFPLASELQEGFAYASLNIGEGMVSPPSRGVKVVTTNGNQKIPPYTSLTLGVQTDEPALCRMDTKRKNNFSEMNYPISEGYMRYEHPFTVPSSALVSHDQVSKSFYGDGTNLSEEYLNLLDGLNLDEANDYDFYIWCQDRYENDATQEFVIQVRVEDGPDTQAPEILSTNYAGREGGSVYIGYDSESYPISVITNEQATCKWSRSNMAYEDMGNNISNCGADGLGQYKCTGQFTGVENRKDNIFYIKCQDKPWWTPADGEEGIAQYANAEPYILTLKGTEPLVIDEVTVNGKENGSIIEGSTLRVNVDFEVKTLAGANAGKSICYFGSQEGQEAIQFYNEGQTGFFSTNVQKNLALAEGNYTYYFKCLDEGGNEAKSEISFFIEIDNDSPQVVRVYKQDGELKIVTDENAQCVYSTSSTIGCSYSFEDGTAMNSYENENYVEWDEDKTFYIKCKDEFENQPSIDECSIVARPYSA